MLRACWLAVLAVNVVTVAVFALDKWRAKCRGARRVPERTLLAWTFATGWVGAWLAMSVFRHKTSKAPFRRWAIVWTLLNPFWALSWWTWRQWRP